RALDGEPGVTALYGPWPAAGAGDVVAVHETLLEQMTGDRGWCEASAAQPGDGVRSAAGGDLVEHAGHVADAVGERDGIPLAVVGQHRRRRLGAAGGGDGGGWHGPTGQSSGVGSADAAHAGR